LNYWERIRASRFWGRLGQPNVIGLPILFVCLIFSALLSFTFDAVRLQNLSFAWIPINIVVIVLVLLFGIPILLFKRKANPEGKNQPVFNVLFMGISFGFKNMLMIYIAQVFGIDDRAEPATRFFGGVILGVSVLIIFTNVVGSRLQREASLAQLRMSESQLRSYRGMAVAQLENESRLAAVKTLNALSPQLEKLHNDDEQSKDILDLVNRMLSFIKNELKPFSAMLASEASSLTQSEKSKVELKFKDTEILIETSNLIRVWLSLLPIPIILFLLGSFVTPSATGVDWLIASVVFALTLAFFKFLSKNLPGLTVPQSFLVTTLVALLSSLPSYYLICAIPQVGGIPELLPVFYILPAWSVIAASQAYILDQNLSRVEQLLYLVVADLARENKLYQQKAWLAKHGWYLLLHGVVQPALTAAVMRATSSEGNKDQVRAQILEDLERALDSFTKPWPKGQVLDFSVTEIQSTWEGICIINVDVDDAVVLETTKDATSRQIINEVMKELVSNAVRHGNASNIVIKLFLDGLGNIVVLGTNDGTRPLAVIPESVGSRMLEAFCLERSLTWNSVTKQTEFKALIPIKM
jgi:hypothetical protein